MKITIHATSVKQPLRFSIMLKLVFLAIALLSHLTVFSQDKSDSLPKDSIMYEIPEVLVKGERPIAVVNGSVITYDLPRLLENKVVDNIYDAIKELPGVVENEGQYQLAGRKVTISLNGQVMTLTPDQMLSLLKSLPVSRLDKADVMYSAPAKTQVRGALINIRLKKETSKESLLNGEINLAYNQKHNAMFGERGAMYYHKGKFSLDAMYLHGHGKEYGVTDEDSHHSLNNGTVHDIRNHQTQLSKSFGHNYRLGAEFDFTEKHKLSFAYQGAYNHRDVTNDYTGNIVGNTLTIYRNWLHNIRLDYQIPFGMKIGAEATYYHDPMKQNLNSVTPTGNLNLLADNDQRINIWRYYLSQEHQLKNNWSLNYGAWHKQSVNHSRQAYLNQNVTPVSYLRQKEDVVNAYVGFGKNWTNKLILDASLSAEYYHSPQWHKWNIYPTLNITYVHNPNNIWLINFSTDRAYPEYWAMNDFTVYGNGGYDEIVGNPYLKPANSYQTQLAWVLKNKYQFVAWFNYIDNYFMQTPYQRPDRLAIMFRTLNSNFQQQAGVQAVLPHKFGSWLDSRLTLTGVWMHEKNDEFYDIPFNRAIFYGMAQINNVVMLSKKSNLSLTVDGMIRSKAKQAIYDLPGSGNLNLGLRWQFWKKQAILHVFCNDIFETSSISPEIDFKGQNLNMHFSCYRQLGLSLTIKFGAYQEKKHKEVDTSRFRK